MRRGNKLDRRGEVAESKRSARSVFSKYVVDPAKKVGRYAALPVLLTLAGCAAKNVAEVKSTKDVSAQKQKEEEKSKKQAKKEIEKFEFKGKIISMEALESVKNDHINQDIRYKEEYEYSNLVADHEAIPIVIGNERAVVTATLDMYGLGTLYIKKTVTLRSGESVDEVAIEISELGNEYEKVTGEEIRYASLFVDPQSDNKIRYFIIPAKTFDDARRGKIEPGSPMAVINYEIVNNAFGFCRINGKYPGMDPENPDYEFFTDFIKNYASPFFYILKESAVHWIETDILKTIPKKKESETKEEENTVEKLVESAEKIHKEVVNEVKEEHEELDEKAAEEAYEAYEKIKEKCGDDNECFLEESIAATAEAIAAIPLTSLPKLSMYKLIDCTFEKGKCVKKAYEGDDLMEMEYKGPFYVAGVNAIGIEKVGKKGVELDVHMKGNAADPIRVKLKYGKAKKVGEDQKLTITVKKTKNEGQVKVIIKQPKGYKKEEGKEIK